ncbi:phosphatidate cytidylyltransferase [Amphibiibacter pelophylacis]|uniref:Phosphatidate cytidylyltransferase n=1 Tax=Amphibiibacter pelophylacis TaxID=1799477 RepID=A0ACC6P3P7_9BURK
MRLIGSLSPGETIGVLFVALFGGLAVLTLIVSLLGARAQRRLTPAHRRRQDATQRDLVALWTSAIVFWLGWVAGPVGTTLLFLALSFLTLRQLITLIGTQRSDHRSLVMVFYGLLPVQYLLVAFGQETLLTVFIPVYGALALPVLSALAGDPSNYLARNAKIQWGVMTTVYGLSHVPALMNLETPSAPQLGPGLVFFMVVVLAVAQWVQTQAERRLMLPPLSRRISRYFTLRGWLLGALAGALTGASLAWITPFGVLAAAVLALGVAAAGLLGSFVLQAIARDTGPRRWNTHRTVTGAVGLLDRLAPLCFAAPVFFHSLSWYFQHVPLQP